MRRLNTILFLIGIVAVVVMLLTFDMSFAQLWDCLRRAGYWFVAAVVLWGALYAMNALAWQTIIRGSGPCPMGFWQIWRLTVSGYALNTTVPVGGVGGEPYRIVEAAKYIGTDRATSSVVLFAMMHVYSHFWFWVTAIAACLLLAVAGSMPLSASMVAVLALASLLCAGGIWLFMRGYRYGLVVRLVHLLGKVPGLRGWGQRFEQTHGDRLARIDQQIAQLRGQNRRSFYRSLLLEYAGRILQSLEVFFMLMLFGVQGGGSTVGVLLTFLHAFLILAFTSLFANLIGFIPLQLGGREGGFALSVAGLGMTAGVGVFISIICRVREIVWAVIGLLLMRKK